MIQWLDDHPTVVIVAIVAVAAVLSVAIAAGRDVMPGLEWLGRLLGQ